MSMRPRDIAAKPYGMEAKSGIRSPVSSLLPNGVKPRSLGVKPFSYCAGCGHGIAHRLVGHAIDELGIREKVIGVAYIGCGGMIYDYLDCDMISPLHGRAPAVATGLKRVRPANIVFTYQGDGDLAAIGTAEIIHAAARGELLTVIFVNNAVYGMTGGQMAPTTLPGQVTTTTPHGRDPRQAGYPMRMAEIIAAFDGVAYVERGVLDSVRNIVRAQEAVRRAFLAQIKGAGLGFVELLASCPTNLRMEPARAMEWVGVQMTRYFPPGVFRDRLGADREIDTARGNGEVMEK